MAKVRLIDYFGFEIGKPDVPEPYPRVLVWGDEFFIANIDDIKAKLLPPRYHLTSGHVLIETRERSPLC